MVVISFWRRILFWSVHVLIRMLSFIRPRLLAGAGRLTLASHVVRDTVEDALVLVVLPDESELSQVQNVAQGRHLELVEAHAGESDGVQVLRESVTARDKRHIPKDVVRVLPDGAARRKSQFGPGLACHEVDHSRPLVFVLRSDTPSKGGLEISAVVHLEYRKHSLLCLLQEPL